MAKISKGYADTQWGQVHYRMTGDDLVGLPITMLHQAKSSSTMFEGVMKELGFEYMIVALDLPGFGGSYRPDQRPSIDLYARATLAALDVLGIEQTWLFGHGTGASVALEMLRERPALAPRLALSAPRVLAGNANGEDTPLELRPDGSHLLQAWARVCAEDPGAPLSLRGREVVLALEAGAHGADADLTADHRQLEDVLRALELPTMVMAGDKDPAYAQLEATYRALRRGRKETLAGHSAYSCDRAPQQVAQLLRDFFQ